MTDIGAGEYRCRSSIVGHHDYRFSHLAFLIHLWLSDSLIDVVNKDLNYEDGQS